MEELLPFSLTALVIISLCGISHALNHWSNFQTCNSNLNLLFLDGFPELLTNSLGFGLLLCGWSSLKLIRILFQSNLATHVEAIGSAKHHFTIVELKKDKVSNKKINL